MKCKIVSIKLGYIWAYVTFWCFVIYLNYVYLPVTIRGWYVAAKYVTTARV